MDEKYLSIFFIYFYSYICIIMKNKVGRPEMAESEKRRPFPGKFKPEIINAIEMEAKKKKLSKNRIVEEILIKEFSKIYI